MYIIIKIIIEARCVLIRFRTTHLGYLFHFCYFGLADGKKYNTISYRYIDWCVDLLLECLRGRHIHMVIILASIRMIWLWRIIIRIPTLWSTCIRITTGRNIVTYERRTIQIYTFTFGHWGDSVQCVWRISRWNGTLFRRCEQNERGILLGKWKTFSLYKFFWKLIASPWKIIKLI